MAAPVLRYYERDIITPGPGLTEISLDGKFQGFDPATGLAILKSIDPNDVLTPAVGGDPPVAGVIAGSLITATQANLSVTYTDPGDRAPVVTWHWFRDGVERGTSTEPTRTFSDTTVPNDSAAHTFFVRGESIDGLGATSNLISLTFGGSTVTAPTAPTGLARHNLTTIQVDYTWAETADSRVDKHGIFESPAQPGINPPTIDNIDPTALSYTRTNQVPGSRHTVVVARHIPDVGAPNNGWSPASNSITYTHPVQAVAHDPVMGSTVNDEWTTGKVARYPNMDACRTYTLGAVVSDLQLTNARVMAVTPNGAGENVGGVNSGATLANNLLAALEDFYYNTNGTPRSGNRNPITGTEYHFATDNETDRNYQSTTPSAAYFDTIRLCRNAIYTLNTDGTRRYPRASMWIDLTQNNIRNHGAGTKFKPAAQYLDGVGCSMYPPGRQAQAAPGSCNNNITFSSYAQYVDEVMTMVQDWMLTGSASGGVSPIKMFATWEFGIPIDHPYRDCGDAACSQGHVYSATVPSGEPTDLTNWTIRPRYLAGGIDSTGKDWTGYLQYVYDKLDAMGCIMREQLYWNQQSNPAIPNPLWHDQSNRAWDARTLPAPCTSQNTFGSTRALIDSETAWFGWVPGSRLAHG